MRESTISFKVNDGFGVQTIDTYEGEYQSLMMLLYDKIFPEDFGECQGMGRCGTCLIKIQHLTKPLTLLDRNENTTLEKMGVRSTDIHLACQILVDESLNGTEIMILPI